ncbi:type I DNA topoisomerase [Patescibacteria group bacterium]
MSKLVIVESPTKAKTITKFLGKDYTVLSSFGHVRDLPKSKMSVDTEKDFAPTYEVPTRSKKNVTDLKRAAKGAEQILLATDEDREGEAIAWHIAEILKVDKDKMKRIHFNEITKSAVEAALNHPRELDLNLVNAQQARRILDRLVGYELSPLLWEKIQYGLSAGRVQSVAVRLVVEREMERRAFKIDEYWTIDAEFEKDELAFAGKLISINNQKLDKLEIKTDQQANQIVTELKGEKFTVTKVEKKVVTKSAPQPFTTSTLQMAANNKLGFSAKQTMTLAQKLYETGKITYMRTDSLNLSEKFLTEAQEFLASQYGKDYATGAKHYKTKKKGAQEAHEAIRPSDPAATPELLKAKIKDVGIWKLYDLIWRRTLATQMPAAKLERTAADLEAKKHLFRANGSTIQFDGFMKIYQAGQEKILPHLAEKDQVKNNTLEANQHFTEPPARYSDATLVKAMEEHEIGRPSTYAPTISTIQDRGYVDRDDNKKLFPTDIGIIVNDFLVEHFPKIVDLEFTARLEKDLDDIAENKKEWVPTLKDFYAPFHKNISDKKNTIKKEDVMKERILGTDPKTGLEVIVRTGRFGPFAQLGEWDEEDKKAKINKPKSGNLPKGTSIDTITLEQAMEIFKLPRTVGQTKDGVDIVAAVGRFGPYLKADSITASIPKDLDPLTITLEQAQSLITEAAEKKKKMETPIAELGEAPQSKGQILVKHGRYGPYVTDGETNASVPKKIDPTTVTREIAIEMLEKKRQAPKRAPRKKAKK